MTNFPCCGHETNAMSLDRLVRVLSAKCAEIVTILNTAPGEFVACENIVRWVYRHDPDGGPMNAASCINQVISYNRPRLAAMGWQIEGRLGPYGGYRLSVHPEAREAA